MLAIKDSQSESIQRPHWIVPVTERHYMVVRNMCIRQETSPGVYSSHESRRTIFFYITSVGANYWMSLTRFFKGVNKFNEACRKGTKPL